MYDCLAVLWFDGKCLSRQWDPHVKEEIQEHLSRQVGTSVSVYAFRDKGAFSKEIKVTTRFDGELTLGSKSDSLVLGVFAINASRRSSSARRNVRAAACDAFEYNPSLLLPLPRYEETYGISSQTALSL